MLRYGPAGGQRLSPSGWSWSSDIVTVPERQPQPRQLFIVRRGRDDTFRLLQRQFSADPKVRVIWDRRHRERRRAGDWTERDRRDAERRAPAPTVWPSTNYIVVNLG
jgi:hypothetical protein